MSHASALIVRENRAFTLVPPEGILWSFILQMRKYKSTDMPLRLYWSYILPDLFLFARDVNALVLYQEELTTDQLEHLFTYFRTERPDIPILLVRRKNGRGGSLNWAWLKEQSRVIDYTEDLRRIAESLNKLIANDQTDRPTLTHSS